MTALSPEVVILTGLAVGIAWVVLTLALKHRAAQDRSHHWQPDLAADSATDGVHILTATEPKWSKMEPGISHTYTVPKNPQDYAKIFVPKDDRKGGAR